MKCLRALGLATILMLWGAVSAGAQTSPNVTLSLPNPVSGSVGTDVIIPLVLATDTPIRSAQAVIEYNNSVIQFVDAVAASKVPGTVNVNDNLPFGPDAINVANDNVLVQWTGSGQNGVSGNLKLIKMRFSVVGDPGEVSDLIINGAPDRTSATTNDPVTTVSGGALILEDGFFEIPFPDVVALRIPQVANATPGTQVQVPVIMNTDEQVGALQVTLNYDSANLTFVDAQLGTDATNAGFAVENINTSLPFSAPTGRSNVLVQLRGDGSNAMTGDDQQVLVLTFDLASTAQVVNNRVPIEFDHNGDRTNVSTLKLKTFRPPGLILADGGVGQSNTWTINPTTGGAIFTDAGVGIFFPPGAVSGNGQITIQPRAFGSVPTPQDGFIIGGIWQIDLDGTIGSPIGLSLPFDPTQLSPGVTASLAYLDVNGEWVRIPSHVEGDQVLGGPSNLSVWTVLTTEGVGNIRAGLPELFFGAVPVGQFSDDRIVGIFNDGTVPIQITDTFIDGFDAFNFELLNPGPAPVLNGGVHDLRLRFAPQFPGFIGADLVVLSNDPDTPELRIPLFGDAQSGVELFDIFADPPGGPRPLGVQFDFSAANEDVIEQWEWDFGDGTPFGGDPRPFHEYTSVGDFNVRLTIRGPGGESTRFRTVNVFNNPPFLEPIAPRLAPFNTPVVLDLVFGDDATPPDQLVLDVTKGNLGDLYDVQVAGNQVILTPRPNTAFVTQVRIQVTDGDGASVEQFVEVNWTAEPIAGVIEATPIKGPPPLGVSFNFVTTQEVLSYEWDFGDGGTSDQSNPFHEYVDPGTYQVSVRITSPAGPQTFDFPQPIEVVAPLAGNLDAFPLSGTAPLDVRLEFSPAPDAGPVDSYTWFFGDGSPEVQTAEPSVNHLYEVSGSFDVSVRIENFATGQEFTVFRDNLVQVGASAPAGQIVAEVLSGGAPLGVPFRYEPAPGSGPVVDFEWDFGDDSGLQGGAAPFHEYFEPGIYQVSLTVFGPDGPPVEIAPVQIEVLEGLPAGFFEAFPTSGTVPLDVQFNFNPAPEGGAVDQVLWNFGDGQDGQGPNPVHTYAQPGNYTIEMTLIGPGGEQTFVQDNLIVVGAAGDLIVNFIVDPPEGPAPLFVQFTDQTAGAIQPVTYQWDFGDPNSNENASSDPNPAHFYNLFGEYEVSLTVTDGQNRTATARRFVRAKAAQPQLFVEANITRGEAPLEVAFNSVVEPRGPNLGPVELEWNFDDGTPVENIPNPVHLFQQPGVYFVNVVARNPDGEDRQEIVIDVQPPQSPQGVVFVDPPSGFAPMATVFRFEPGPESGVITSFSWDFGDGGQSDDPNPFYIYQNPGFFEPTLTLRGPGGEVSVPVPPVEVREVAGLIAEFDAPFEVKTGEPVVFFNRSSGQGQLQFNWEFDDPISGGFNFSSQRNPSHIFAEFGEYSITLTVIDELGRTAFVEKPIRALPPELPPVSIFAEPASGFAPLEVRFESFVPVDPALAGQIEYRWDFGDGGQSDVPNPVYAYENPGDFQARLTVIGPGGETFAEFPVLVQAPVLPGGDIAVTQRVGFAPMPVGFDYVPAPGSGKVDNFAWNFGDGATFESPDPFADHIYDAPGLYDVSLTLTGPGGENTIVREGLIEVQSRFPVGSFTARPATGLAPLPVVFNFQPFPDSGPIDQITWDFGDGSAPGDGPNPTHTYEAAGVYDVIVTLVGPGGENPIGRPGLVVVTNPGDIVANFQVNPPDGPAPLTVGVNNQSLGQGQLRYEWNFGDPRSGSANISNDRNPQHTYEFFGDYQIQLTVTDELERTATIEKPVFVFPEAPRVSIGADRLSGIAPLTVRFESNVPAGANLGDLSYQWDFGDGNSSPNPNPVHTFQEPGQYPVTLQVFGPGGEAFAELNIDAKLPDAPTGTIQVSQQSGPPPLIVEFRFIPGAGSSPIFGFEWDFGPAGGSSQPNPIRRFNEPGDYPVSLTLFGAGGETRIDLPEPIQVLAALPSGDIEAQPQAGPAPLETQFFFISDFVSGPVDAVSWNFGDDSPPVDGFDAAHTYAGPGNYTVSATLTGPGGEVTVVRENFVTVTQPGELVANFRVSPPEGRAPLNVRFEDASSGGANLKYEWDFGDPASGPFNFSNQRNPSHAYNQFGEFFARLTVTDELDRSAVTERRVSVKAAQPTVSIRADKLQGKAPLTVHFNSQVGPQGPNLGAVRYLWEFGTGRTDASPSPVQTFNEPGVYPVSLEVNTPGGSALAFVEIFVEAAQKPAGIFFAEPPVGSAPLPVRFEFVPNRNSGLATDFRWNFGDGTTGDGPSPLHTYTQPGRYTVSLVVAGPGGETTIVQQDAVQIQDRPPVGDIEAAPASGPAPLDVEFRFFQNRSSGPVDALIWNFGDGSPSAEEPNPIHTYQAPGTYTVSLLATGPGGEASFSRVGLVEVFEPGDLVANFRTSTESGRAPLSVAFFNETVGENLIFEWDFGDPESGPFNFSNRINASHNYNRPGEFLARLTVRDALGREALKEKVIRVQAKAPVASILAEPPVGIAPLDVAFTSTVRNLGDGTIEWNFGDGSPPTSDPNPLHLFELPGVYPVALTVTSSGGETRVVRNVEVLLPPLPSGVIQVSETRGFAPLEVAFDFVPDLDSGPFETFAWNFGDGSPPGAGPNPVHLYEQPGIFRASVVVSGPAGDAIIDLNVPIEVSDQLPFGAIFADPVAGFAPLPVNFAFEPAPDSGPITSLTWNFGDGAAPGDGFNPSHTYDAPGTYTVEVQLEGPGGRNLIVAENLVEVSTAGDVVANFTFDPREGVAPVRVQFNQQAFGAGDLTYAWDFGDPNSGPANTSDAPDARHTYNVFGDYPVTLTVTDGLSRVATKTQVLRVRPVKPFVTVRASQYIGPPPLHVNFFSEVGPRGPNLGQVTYSWDFDDGSVASVPNPTHQFTTPGSYEVQLTVNTLGGEASESIPIEVVSLPLPAGRITAAPRSGIAPLPVNFSVRRSPGSGPVDGFSWDFGDGGQGEGRNVRYVYSGPGVYTVTLTMVGPGGETVVTETDLVEVGAAGEVIANFGVSTDRGVSPLTVSFTDASTGNGDLQYFWNFGDPDSGPLNASTQPQPTHTFQLVGDYPVTLTVTDATGRSATKEKIIQVVPPKPVVFITGFPREGDVPLEVAFQSKVGPAQVLQGALRYRWDFGDGTPGSTEPDPNHVYAAPGVYDVQLTVTGAGGVGESAVLSIEVLEPLPPLGDFAASPTSGFVPLDVSFAFEPDPAGGPFDVLTWDFGDGSPPVVDDPIPVHTYGAPGTYTVTVTLTGPGGETPLVQEDLIVVSQPGEVVANFGALPATGPAPLDVTFRSQSDGTGILTYLWDFDDPTSADNSSTSLGPDHTFEAFGTHDVTLTVTDALGQTGSITKPVVVTAPKPIVQIEASVKEGIAPLPVTFTSTVGPEGVDLGELTYEWDFGDGPVVGTPEETHTFEAAGVQTVTLTVTGPDDFGVAATGVSVLFPNRPPTAPVFSSPGNGDVDLPLTLPLVWQPSSDPDQDEVTYTILLGAGQETPSVLAEGVLGTSLPIGPLAQSTRYTAQVVAVDARGAEVEGSVIRFTTRGDVEPPRFTRRPFVIQTSPTTARVRWNTNEPSTTQVRFGIGALDQQTDENDAAGVLEHSVDLLGLQPGATYLIQAVSVDISPNANVGESAEIPFTLEQQTLTPLAFNGEPIVLDRTPTTATVFWQTNRLSSTLGDILGATQRAAKQTAGAAFVGVDGEDHTLIFDRLIPNTDYQIEVHSVDAAGQEVRRNLAFNTLPADQVVPPPTISEPGIVSTTESEVVLAWKTDVPSTTVVRFGLAPALGVFEEVLGDAGVIDHQVTVTGLDAGTPYFLQPVSSNPQGESLGPILSTTTLAKADTDPPVIEEGPIPLGLTQTSVTVAWKTDKASDSKVSITGPEGALTPVFDPAPVIEHSLTVSGLTANTAYSLVVTSVGAASQLPISSDPLDVTTKAEADKTPPVILSDPAVPKPEPTTLKVIWGTNEPATSIVAFAPEGGDFDERVDPGLVKQHNVLLTNLTPGTNYTIRVRSKDLANNESETRSTTVRTKALAAADKKAPKITTPPSVPSSTDVTATVTWTTDEEANGIVRFGLSDDALDGQRGNATEFSIDHTVQLTGLTAQTAYFYKVLSTDPLQNGPTESDVQSFTTRAAPDTKPAQVVSGPVALPPTKTSVTIEWGTDELGDSRVEYSAGDALGGDVQSLILADKTQGHSVTLSGLTPGTRYAYRVGSQDVARNPVVFSDVKTFDTVPEVVVIPPPKIVGGPSVPTLGPNSATVVWDTDKPTTGLIEYGAGNYDLRLESIDLSTGHSFTLDGLEANIAYRFRVTSKAQDGKLVTTDPTLGDVDPNVVRAQRQELSFTTPSVPDNTPPNISGLQVEISGGNAKVSWLTDEPATGVVFYGTLDDYGVAGQELQQTQDEGGLSQTHTVTLRGLDLSERFLYRVESTDGENNTAVLDPRVALSKSARQPPGGLGSFLTDTSADTQQPLILNGPTQASASANELVIAWETDESTTPTVRYKPVAGSGAAKAAKQGVTAERVIELAAAQTSHQILLNNLDAATRYAYTIEATDLSGNRTVSAEAYATTTSEADVNPPKLVGAPKLVYLTDRSATISWELDELADGSIKYGVKGEGLTASRVAVDNSKTPSITLTNLQANTTYEYQVASADLNRNGPTESTVLSFTTEGVPDLDPPQIVGDVEVVTVSDQSATIRWTTNELADRAVKYGANQSLDLVAGSATDDVTHVVTLSNLTRGTTYAFQVESTDASGNGPTFGPILSFTTLAEADSEAPAVPQGLAALAGASDVVLTWQANAESDLVGYDILRAVGEGAFETIASRVNATQFRDAGLDAGTTYQYALIAVDQASNKSAQSDAQSAAPDAANVLASPSSAGATGDAAAAVLSVFNVTPIRDGSTMTYEFQVSTRQDFSDIVTATSGLAEGANSTKAGFTNWPVDRALQGDLTYYWRVRANDGFFNGAFSDPQKLEFGAVVTNTGDFNSDGRVDFTDFIQFAGGFGTSQGDAGYSAALDLDGDGTIAFGDFIQFAQVFGTVYASGKLGASDLPEDLTAQVVLQTDLTMPKKGQTFEVTVDLSGVQNPNAYGLELWYDETRVTYVDASAPEDAPLFGVLKEDAGRVYLGGRVAASDAETAGLAVLTFRILTDPGADALVGIADLVIDDLEGRVRRVVDRAGLDLAPKDFALYPSYPNPFNPVTTIPYAVPEASEVRLAVYNVLGQEVVELIRADHQPGHYRIAWGGRDAAGRQVASGVYLVRMQAGSFSQVNKMILMK